MGSDEPARDESGSRAVGFKARTPAVALQSWLRMCGKRSCPAARAIQQLALCGPVTRCGSLPARLVIPQGAAHVARLRMAGQRDQRLVDANPCQDNAVRKGTAQIRS
jgi:hypothetical protein